jgi:hypothetical protein
MADSLPSVPEYDPFAALGLAPSPDVSSDDVRAAFLRIAAATHPDRDDGGDPARYTAAAAAYTRLGTEFGRAEAYAETLGVPVGTVPLVARRPLLDRVRGGRPLLLTARFVLGLLVFAGSVAVAGWNASTLAIALLLLTWCVRTGRYDLALCTGRWPVAGGRWPVGWRVQLSGAALPFSAA